MRKSFRGNNLLASLIERIGRDSWKKYQALDSEEKELFLDSGYFFVRELF